MIFILSMSVCMQGSGVIVQEYFMKSCENYVVFVGLK